jgi:outer membrane protein assembly factor BamA
MGAHLSLAAKPTVSLTVSTPSNASSCSTYEEYSRILKSEVPSSSICRGKTSLVSIDTGPDTINDAYLPGRGAHALCKEVQESTLACTGRAHYYEDIIRKWHW